METGVRGFSFMPETKVEVMDMQYIESEELERTWKSSRRQRLKQQEQKIWEEFVKEQDILSHVCKDDPYQFLQQLPESCLKELMEIELSRMKAESVVEQPEDFSVPFNKVISTSDESYQEVVVDEAEDEGFDLSQVEDDPEEGCHVFVFDNEDGDTDGEDEVPPSPAIVSPDTVRERSPKRPSTPDRLSNKSSENMQSVIENSVHSAKVKDLRAKINEEILAVITTLEQKDVSGIEPEELTKMYRRSAEFCTRFNRNHLYQLQRQVQDIKRNCAVSLPFARHTQLQSQMIRIVSLHQNLLQALQVLHKSAGSASSVCGADSAAAARALCGAVSAATEAARAVHQAAIYDDDLPVNCAKLEEAFAKHEAKISDFFSVRNTNSSRSRRSSNLVSKKSTTMTTWSKSGTKMRSDAQSRLSMYSLDTLRHHTHQKPSRFRDNLSSGTSKGRGRMSPQPDVPSPSLQKVVKKSPRSRRPLMRGDTARTQPRQRDARVRTLVECTSSRVSCDTTALVEATLATTTTPRGSDKTPRSGGDNRTTRQCDKAPRSGGGDRTARQCEKTPRRCDESPQNDKTQHKRLHEIPKFDDKRDMKQALVGDFSQIKTMGEDVKIREKNQMSVVRPSPRRQGKINPKTALPLTPTRRNVEINFNDGTPKGVSMPSPNSKDRDGTRPATSTNNQKTEHNRTNISEPRGCEVTRIVRELCGGDAVGLKNERVYGAKNAQLYCVSGSSPRQPSTPQLLRILEESIQKKAPVLPMGGRWQTRDAEELRLPLGVPAAAAERLRRRRAGFLQHMLSSPLYANSALAKPWEAVERVSEQLIDDLLLQCAKEMQLDGVVCELYNTETFKN